LPATAQPGARIAVDVGGTFTDLVLLTPDDRMQVSKVSSTTERPDAAVVEGTAALLQRAGVAADAVTEVLHGTTVASNTILQKAGARTGLLTTRGFRDVLEIARIRTPEMFDLTWDKPEPLVPRRWRLEVDERMAADGSVVTPLDADGVRAAVERLLADGVDSLAVAFINSYANPAHELQAEELLRQHWPQLPVSVSARVLPEIKEYERTSTTVVNAYLQPVMRTYLERLQAGLAEIGIHAPLLVIASNGGVASARATAEKPVFSVGSGPAAGVAGAARLGLASDQSDLIAFDMGGTTAKAALIEGGRLTLTNEYEFREGISTSSRFIKAGGYMMKVPAIDIAEVGAGGGSVAEVDAGGLLKVGPHSAGADPGPACYGRGGTRPTVTDASVVLGYLNPRHLAGGALEIDADLAARAIDEHIAVPLGIDPIAAAHGIRAVANANMARALRAVSVERGRDPRDVALMAFGGSAALHAVDLARALELPQVLVPALPGVFTAVGMLASDVEHHFVRPFAASLHDLDLATANTVLGTLTEEAGHTLAAEGFGDAQRRITYQADLRYPGQSEALTIGLDGERLDAAGVAALAGDFQAAYEASYGYASSREQPEIVNLRAVATGLRRGRLRFDAARAEMPATAKHAGERTVSFSRGEPPIATPVCDRAAIGATPVPGPLIVESYESTILLPPGASARCDHVDNIVITPGQG